MSIRLLRFLRIISLSLSLFSTSFKAGVRTLFKWFVHQSSGARILWVLVESCFELSHDMSVISHSLHTFFFHLSSDKSVLSYSQQHTLYRSSIVGSNPVACLTLNLTIPLRTSRDSRRVSPLTLLLRDSIRREVGSTRSWCSPQLCSTNQHGRILL